MTFLAYPPRNMTLGYFMRSLIFFPLWVFAPLGLAAPTGSYPVKPVRIITASAGTSGDLLARFLSQRISERWGQPVVVENRPGAGAVIAAEIAAKAAPDGYSLHLGQHGSFAAAPSLYKKLAYDPEKDFAPIAQYAQVPFLIVAHPALPANNMKEFITYARTHPGQINFSSGGSGGVGHLNFELLNFNAQLKLVHIPYKGIALATSAVISGEVQVTASPVPVVLPFVHSGKVKTFALTGNTRFAGAPGVPTVAEAGFADFDATTWFALFAPAKTPMPIIVKINHDMVDIINTPAARQWLLTQGAQPNPGTPEALRLFLKQDIAKWAKVIQTAGIKAD
jgi:tripartite-type tricarboxylate transporter receptor subunit TctC